MHCSCSGPETGTVLVARPWGIGAILHKALDTLNNKIQSYGTARGWPWADLVLPPPVLFSPALLDEGPRISAPPGLAPATYAGCWLVVLISKCLAIK